MKDRICQVTVNNVPEHASGYIVARVNEEDRSLWYWGCWDSKEEAEECARNVEGVVVKSVPDLSKYLEEHFMVAMDKDVAEKAIKALEQQPCEDCISRAEVLKILEKEEFKGDAIYEIEKKLPSLTPKTEQKWIPVSERLPEDFGTYLITLENGDVCWGEFNPDYTDEEHDKGAFTYYHEYYDIDTLGFIDAEECAVDAIAWRTLEPYKAESEE